VKKPRNWRFAPPAFDLKQIDSGESVAINSSHTAQQHDDIVVQPTAKFLCHFATDRSGGQIARHTVRR